MSLNHVTTVIVGQMVTLMCNLTFPGEMSGTDIQYWEYSPSATVKFQHIVTQWPRYNDTEYGDTRVNCTVTNDFNLVYSGVQEPDGGLYRCGMNMGATASLGNVTILEITGIFTIFYMSLRHLK